MNIEQIILTYLPTILMVVGYVINFGVIISKLKSFSFKKDTEELKSSINKLVSENQALRRQNTILIEKLTKVKNYERETSKEE